MNSKLKATRRHANGRRHIQIGADIAVLRCGCESRSLLSTWHVLRYDVQHQHIIVTSHVIESTC